MLQLLQIDLKKLTSYRTFWIICGLYFFTLGMTTASGMEFLKWLSNTFQNFDSGFGFNVNRIPLYHFPDVWQNLAWASGFLKIMPAILVVISVTNEYTYRTIRQNIIDGLSRENFLVSKIGTNVLLSLLSAVLIFVIALTTGLIYSPELEFPFMLTGVGFYAAYFLEVFAFLSFALMVSFFVQRSGLTIIILLTAFLIELYLKAKVDDYFPALIQFFPLESISNLVPMPLPRYWFREIRDYVSVGSVAIALGWVFVFNFLAYLKLKKSDI